jgi:iron complex transport system permease protein
MWGGAGIALLLLSIVVSLSFGTAQAQIPIHDVWRILWHQLPVVGDLVNPDWNVSAEQIVLKVRFPRIMLAVLVGACLSLAGAGFQGVLRNPLADPYTLGVASGSAVGASFLILFGLQTAIVGIWSVPIVAFMTGMLSLLIVLRLASMNGKFQLETLILSGVVVQAFLGSFVSFMVSLSDQVVNEILNWLMGSLTFKGWAEVGVLVPYLVIGLLVLLSYGRTLNLFALGERQAEHLGINVGRTRLIVLMVSTLITAAAVSMSGTVGFVGLVVPHLVRLMVGPDYRMIIPITALFGASYLLWADTLARLLLSPTEIPLGVVTSFLGAPFFIYLLRKHKRKMGM